MAAQLNSSLPTDQSRGWNFESEETSLTLRCESQTLITSLSNEAGIQQTWSDPLAALRWMAEQPFPSSEHRWVGYLSYDLGRLFEELPANAVDDLRMPLFHFSLMNRSTVTRGSGPCGRGGAAGRHQIESSLPKEQFLDRVRRAIDYIRAGDIFQVNLSQRLTVTQSLDARHIWQNLLDRTPAAYGAFLDCVDHQIISNSPELFFHVDAGRNIITRPIKGTRPRQPGMREALLHSEKDQAELNMIVDLERNDLGRVCETGSVRVTQPRTIEEHPTVYHGVAAVEGRLKNDVAFVDLLNAIFPGGSITGAPKIRAMQIIEELEPVRRGAYCGAIGYLAADGSMQFNVAIRTMIIKDGQVHLPVGGGIVADSDPSQEYEETLVKATAMLRALSCDGSQA